MIKCAQIKYRQSFGAKDIKDTSRANTVYCNEIHVVGTT